MRELTKEERAELSALSMANDALGGPSFIARNHWRESGYCRFARAGLVKWGDPPGTFDRRRFAGIEITTAGRAALAARTSDGEAQ